MTQTQINLTKKAVGDGHLRVTTDGQFITNGHWACRLSLVKQAPFLTTLEAARAFFPRADVDPMEPEVLSMVIPRYSSPTVYTRTRWVDTTGDDDSCLFTAKSGSQLWLARKYVDLFDLDAVTSECVEGDAACSEAASVGEGAEFQVLVMPKRIDFVKDLS